MHFDRSLKSVDALDVRLVEQLFDLPRTVFSIKDSTLRYVAGNRGMLDLCGVKDRQDFIGKSSRHFFAESGRQRYEGLDQRVMRTGRAVRDQLDFTVRHRGQAVWVMLSRLPITLPGHPGVAGVAVVGRVLAAPDRRHPTYQRLSAAVEHIAANLGGALDVDELAAIAGTSVSQLERDFVAVFGLPPRRYLTKMRLDAALDMLATDRPIAEIAQFCGYGDQSAFSRRFHAVVGMSPSDYRRMRTP